MTVSTVLEAGLNDEDLTAAARAAIWGAWTARSRLSGTLHLRREYGAGRGAIPDLDDGASEELQDIARVSRLSMARVVMKTYARGLSVVGFRSPNDEDDDPSWWWWQAHRLDARQNIVHRGGLTYGTYYVSVLPDERTNDPARPAFWGPSSCIAEFEEPDDAFPRSAVLIKHTAQGHSVLLVDETTVTPGILRSAPRDSGGEQVSGVRRQDVEVTGEPWLHGATYEGMPVCPVVRFVDESEDDERTGIGVVEPVIDLTRAITQVNFDRLVVSRFGAHDQKLIIGWSTTKDRLLKLSAAHVGAIDEHPDDVRIDSWKPSPLSPYNELIKELREQVALEGAIPAWAAGSISNVSTDTVAMLEGAHQRELALKRESYGESWEQVLRLAVAMSGGGEPDIEAEVVWRETESRTFAGVVDGIQKLASIPAQSDGIPVEELLDLIPGMTQQRIRTIRDGIRRRRADGMVASLLDIGNRLPPVETPPAES